MEGFNCLDFLGGIHPLVISLVSMSTGFLACYIYILDRTDKSMKKRILECLFRLVESFPPIKTRVNAKIEEVSADLRKSIHIGGTENDFIHTLPERGIETNNLIQKTQLYASASNYNSLTEKFDSRPAFLNGRISGAAFSPESDEAERRVYQQVFEHFAYSNPLWPKLYPGVRKMEAEVVRMCCDIMNGGPESCGTMSTGGTMSILLACLAHRNRAFSRGVIFPEMVLPTSAHAAFYKAAEVFRIRVVKIDLDSNTFEVDVKAMRRAITCRTCMLVGSAPNFPFGTIDDITAIGQLGLEYDIPVHVDACLGGFLLPFLDDQPPFDFRVPGVTSISADPHKYGLTPKGASVVLYSHSDYRKHQYHTDAEWQGGIYASATLEGSRCGLNIALCWAALLYHGKEKYSINAQKIVKTTRRFRDGVRAIPQLRLQGAPETCIVSWTSDVINIYRIHQLLGRKGWQLSALQYPKGMHIMVTLNHCQEGVVEEMLEDLQEVVDYCMQNPEEEKPTGTVALYGMAQRIPDSLVRKFASCYLDACYSTPPTSCPPTTQ